MSLINSFTYHDSSKWTSVIVNITAGTHINNPFHTCKITLGAHTTSVFTIGTHITSLAYNLQSNTTTTNTSVVHVDDIAKVTSPPPTDTPTTKITFASFDSSTYNISGGWANFDTTDKNTIVS